MTDSVAFSCCVDSEDASLWIHWREVADQRRFFGSRIGRYDLHSSRGIREFRAAVRNIIDYGFGDRQSMINSALQDVLPLLPVWDKEDKATRSRKSSDIDDTSSAGFA